MKKKRQNELGNDEMKDEGRKQCIPDLCENLASTAPISFSIFLVLAGQSSALCISLSFASFSDFL